MEEQQATLYITPETWKESNEEQQTILNRLKEHHRTEVHSLIIRIDSPTLHQHRQIAQYLEEEYGGQPDREGTLRLIGPEPYAIREYMQHFILEMGLGGLPVLPDDFLVERVDKELRDILSEIDFLPEQPESEDHLEQRVLAGFYKEPINKRMYLSTFIPRPLTEARESFASEVLWLQEVHHSALLTHYFELRQTPHPVPLPSEVRANLEVFINDFPHVTSYVHPTPLGSRKELCRVLNKYAPQPIII